MRLYLVHCGFYDKESGDGIYESHVNFFVVASDFSQAKQKAKTNPRFKTKQMHVDGIQEISVVDGYEIHLQPAKEENRILTIGYEQLASL